MSLNGAVDHIRALKERAFKAEEYSSRLTYAVNQIVNSFAPFLKSFGMAKDEFNHPMIAVHVYRDHIVAALRACKKYNELVNTPEKGKTDEL